LGFPKYSNVTAVIIQLGVPSFDTVMHNAKVYLGSRLRGSMLRRTIVDTVLRFADMQAV